MSNTNETTYEGWTNRATWLVNLHLNNDQSVYEYINEMMSKEQRLIDAESALRDFVDSVFNEAREATFVGMLTSDLIAQTLGQVNWREIVEGWVSGLDEFEVGKNEGDDMWQIISTENVNA